MNVDGMPYRTIRLGADGWSVEIIDQTLFPHTFAFVRLASLDDAARAIRDMQVRGAPLIGATAAYGLALAMRHDASDGHLAHACTVLAATRPTAVNLRWALERVRSVIALRAEPARAVAAYGEAARIADEDVATNRAIGEHGFALIRAVARLKAGVPVHILTHCNAGWLATVDWGTATAPIYMAHDAGIPLHVWVDETRPRNQGAALTAWELGRHGVPHTVVVDNAGGHLMQRGLVDMVIVGSDRTTAAGDVCNKIGTYLKALAARDNGVPFYVALPSSTIDFTMMDGLAEIPIEERAGDEVAWISGATEDGQVTRVRLIPEGSLVANYAFDVTPARLVSGLITERGVISATREAIAGAFPERVARA
ncbi:MAG: S-methyl-5-thioribose-1-phosphate isomerase [Hyphomicrobiaceae bacterium]